MQPQAKMLALRFDMGEIFFMADKKIKVKDLIPDTQNFNKGNVFGESLIEKSFDKFGAGRSILLDKNNQIIAGNKSTQKFVEQGGENVIVVETDGKTLVAVKRKDIDLNTKRGREMALADNASAKANIEWDTETVSDWSEEIEFSDWGVPGFESMVDMNAPLIEETIQPVSYAHFLISIDINEVDKILPLIQEARNTGAEIESNVN